MSFLNENQHEELANFLAGQSESGVQDNGSQQRLIEPQAQDVQAVNSSRSASEEKDEGHAVPYSRFKSVVQARNDLRSQVEEYEKQLATLTSQMNAKQQDYGSKQGVSAFDELYSQISKDYNEEPLDERDLKLQRLEKVAYDFEVFQAKQQLEQELAVANSKYPDVPKDLLLAAVVQQPDIDVVDLAERYNTFVSSVREDAIAKYTQTGAAGQTSVTPSAPPRVGSAPATRTTTGFGEIPAPRNLQEAKSSLMDYLKSAGWR